MSLISVIVTTYNRPDALRACLDSLGAQSDQDFEILVADDGSGIATRESILHYQAENPGLKDLIHVYQEDRGFRAGTIRNRAVACSNGDYIVFMDGDCVVFPDFIANHRKLAEPGYFVPGNRILLCREYTDEVLREKILLYRKSFAFFFGLRVTGKINRSTSLIRFPLGPLRRLRKTRWQQAKTCNLGLYKKDFVTVNGFDETFEGWGYEDSDLVIRLIHAGIHRKTGRFAVPVLHLWHPENDRSRHDTNLQRFLERVANKEIISAEVGFDRHFSLRSTSPVAD
ncbi:MAG: glycosyltransferase family 2 protein [Gammaproteobacteria bacterium]